MFYENFTIKNIEGKVVIDFEELDLEMHHNIFRYFLIIFIVLLSHFQLNLSSLLKAYILLGAVPSCEINMNDY